MNFKNRLSYHILEEGIKQLDGSYETIKEIFNLHYPNYIKTYPNKKDFITKFEDVLEYIKRNKYIKPNKVKIFKITKKGEDFLKEQREIAYKEEQNYILKKQLHINKLMILATSISAFGIFISSGIEYYKAIYYGQWTIVSFLALIMGLLTMTLGVLIGETLVTLREGK